uniref:dTDP-6-deoxy-L-hexose 3-O-methyltransferase n=1 Tax=viral metagenome TaxID=1070528 RepID=A0A6C0KYX3_9ZZZZ
MLEITNNNTKLNTDENVYESFNNFIFSNDVKVIGKLLHRFEYFNKIKDLPGDIIEIGVFKGSGIATFSKFLEIYCPNSNKKVIGFDIFQNNSDEILSKDIDLDKNNMNTVYSRVNIDELTLESVEQSLIHMNIHKKYILVEGDVEVSLPSFLEKNPGLRISLLYIDCDIERPTYYSLKYLWDRILPGGIILFDEYEHHSFSESNGVDKFLKENNIKYNIKTTNFMCPTAYLIKE